MKYFFYKSIFSLLFLGCFHSVNAQHITPENLQLLKTAEDSLKKLSDDIINSEDAETRFASDRIFTKQLVQALKINNSFYFPFDSIFTVSRLYAPDSSFRIFTWQYKKDETYFRQRGAIQMHTDDGSLKLFPLFDYSDFTENPTDSVRKPNEWIGAIYYKIILKEYLNKKYYTLLGFDDNSSLSNKKWMEVLTFSQDGNPVFGGRYFDYRDEEIKPKQPAYRFCLEYKKDATVRFNYDPEMDLIVFEHLTSTQNSLSQKETLIPDGDFEGFKWTNGKWVHIDDIFAGTPKEPTPIPEPLRDANGNINEQKLIDQSIINKSKAKTKK